MERYFKFSELSKLEQQMYYNYIYLFLMEANMQYPGVFCLVWQFVYR